jgi:hypothetical protein
MNFSDHSIVEISGRRWGRKTNPGGATQLRRRRRAPEIADQDSDGLPVPPNDTPPRTALAASVRSPRGSLGLPLRPLRTRDNRRRRPSRGPDSSRPH